MRANPTNPFNQVYILDVGALLGHFFNPPVHVTQAQGTAQHPFTRNIDAHR